jgi:Tol biopolymer transport system component
VLADGRGLPGRLLFVSDSNVWLLDRGQSVRLTPDRISRQPSWSRDGKKIALVKIYSSGSDLWVMDASGANSEEMTDFSYRQERQQNYALRPAWLPDGAGLLYLSEQASQDTQLWQLTLEDRRRRRFLPPAADGLGGVDAPAFSPDGATLAVTAFLPGQGQSGPVNRSQIWLWSLSGGPWKQVSFAPDGAYDPTWSPDATHLAFAVRSAGKHDIWIARADGSGARQVTTAGACRAPAWSPDGAWLTYLSAQSGTFDLWAVPLGQAPAANNPDATPTGPTGPARAITRGGVVDAASGLSWTS